jgi:hypothetical protein
MNGMSVATPFVAPLKNFLNGRSRRRLPHLAEPLNRFSRSLSTFFVPLINRVERSALAIDCYRFPSLDLFEQRGHIGPGICETDIFHGVFTP